jgi:hypothetical protein
MTDVLEEIININRPAFAYICGNVNILKFINDKKKNIDLSNHIAIHNNVTILEESIDNEHYLMNLEMCINEIIEDKKIEIYLNFSHENFNMKDSLEYAQRLYYSVENNFMDIDGENYEEVDYLDNFLHMGCEAIKIGAKNEMYQSFGYGKQYINHYIQTEDGNIKMFKDHLSIVLDNFSLYSEISERDIYIKIIACFNNIQHVINDKFDICQNYIDCNDKFISLINKNKLHKAVEEKTINISLDTLKRKMWCSNYSLNNKIFKRFMNQLLYFSSENWKIYLNIKLSLESEDCDCNSRNCLCKIRLGLNEVRTINYAVASCMYYYDKITKVENYNNFFVLKSGKYIKKYCCVYKFKENPIYNDREMNNFNVINDNSYRNFMTIFYKIQMNREFVEYCYREDNFAKFKLLDMYREDELM